MASREQELALLESAALQSEAAERIAEASFDGVYEAAERDSALNGVTQTPEFREWMAARAKTDDAWGRWAQLAGDEQK